MKKDKKEPLFRKENKSSLKTHYYVKKGGDLRHERHTKKMKNFEGNHQSMKSGKFDYDYTPLFRFLQSKVGKKWDDVYSEAVSRLNDTKPIFWLVKLHKSNSIVELGKEDPITRIGENSYWHTLTVNEDGILVYIDKTSTITPSCSCCTTALDGKVVKQTD